MRPAGVGRGLWPLASFGGTVTYRGKQVSEANVVFIPDSGTPAFANTEASGVFTWSTEGQLGALIEFALKD